MWVWERFRDGLQSGARLAAMCAVLSSGGIALGAAQLEDPQDDPTMPGRLRLSGGVVYLQAVTTRHGLELFRTDGTREGTVLVADIWPGPRDSDPEKLLDLDGTLLFVADDGEHGRELWRSDGTEAGTRLVIDLVPGEEGSDPTELTRVGARLGDIILFPGDDGVHRRELWRTDGTAAGTVMVKNIVVPADELLVDYSSTPGNFVVYDGALLFTASVPDMTTWTLWRSDGTSEGTVQVLTGEP